MMWNVGTVGLIGHWWSRPMSRHCARLAIICSLLEEVAESRGHCIHQSDALRTAWFPHTQACGASPVVGGPGVASLAACGRLPALIAEPACF